jgi:cytochrome c-type biogenesis protein CcmH
MKCLFVTRYLFISCLLAFTHLAHAGEAAPLADDPVLEARMNKLAEELRCLVCQNESLAGSRADLAQDLRREVREKMRQGMSDEQIKTYLVERYGDFVLYRPPVKSTTWLLWFGPFLLLGGGIGGFVYFLQRRRKTLPDAPLSAEEEARVKSLLDSNKP